MHPRPDWARRLDRWTVRAARLLGRVLGRPSDTALASLAQQDRPAPPIDIPDFGPDHLADGRQAFADGRFAEALHHFGQLVDADPKNPWAWHGRGDALLLLGDAAGALEAYERSALLAPRVGLHRGGVANALASLGREDEARTAWAAALALDPSLTWMRPANAADGR